MEGRGQGLALDGRMEQEGREEDGVAEVAQGLGPGNKREVLSCPLTRLRGLPGQG